MYFVWILIQMILYVKKLYKHSPLRAETDKILWKMNPESIISNIPQNNWNENKHVFLYNVLIYLQFSVDCYIWIKLTLYKNMYCALKLNPVDWRISLAMCYVWVFLIPKKVNLGYKPRRCSSKQQQKIQLYILICKLIFF